MSHDREAPRALLRGEDLGLTPIAPSRLTLPAGTVRPGETYVMSDERRDELYMTALTTDVTRRFTRPMGTPGDACAADGGRGEAGWWSRRQQIAAAGVRERQNAADRKRWGSIPERIGR